MARHAQELDLSELLKLPWIGGKKRSKLLTIGVPVMSLSLVLLAILWNYYIIEKAIKFKYDVTAPINSSPTSHFTTII